MGFIF
jgi:hypothetical protein